MLTQTESSSHYQRAKIELIYEKNYYIKNNANNKY